MHAVAALVIVIHTPCGTICEYIVSKQKYYVEVYQIVIILKGFVVMAVCSCH